MMTCWLVGETVPKFLRNDGISGFSRRPAAIKSKGSGGHGTSMKKDFSGPFYVLQLEPFADILLSLLYISCLFPWRNKDVEY